MDRACERCGAIDGSDYDSDDRPAAMCVEIQIAYGVMAWLCFDCRKQWYSKIRSEMLSKQYSETTLRFEHWKALVAAKGKGDIEDGLNLWRQLDELENKLNALAHEWLIHDVDGSPNSLYYRQDD
jgi:hypothetical protein